MKKRLLSMLLVLCMVISILPMSVLAAGTPAVTVYRSPITDPYVDGSSAGSRVSAETLAAWKAAIYEAAGIVNPADAEIYYYVASVVDNDLLHSMYPDCYVPIDYVVPVYNVNTGAGFGYQATMASKNYKDTEKVHVVSDEGTIDVDVTIIGALETEWDVNGVTETGIVEIGAVPSYPGDEAAITRFLGWDPQPVAPATTNVAVPLSFTAKISAKDVDYVTPEIVVEGVDASNTVSITYGEDAALAASVEIEGAAVALDVPDTKTLPVGTHTFTISYPGAAFEGADKDTVYRKAETTITVKVAKDAAASVAVDNAVVKYGTAVNPADLIHSGSYSTIDILAGLDVAAATKPAGVVTVAMPGGADMCQAMGIDPTNVSLNELKELIHALNDALPVNEATVIKVINTVKSLKSALEAKQDIVKPQIKIEVVDKLDAVTNVGAYLLASAIYDANYETEMGAGYIVITPDGEKVTLKWNYNDPNYVVTLNSLTGIDLGASVASGDAAAQKHVETLFIGVDQNITDGVKEGVFVGRTLPADAYPGIYMEIAMIADWGNEMYYSEPIVRPIVVAPNAAKVEFVDENGNANNIREYVYDGTAKALTVEVDGVVNPTAGELKVRYIGIDGHASLKGMNLTTELSNIYDGPDAAAAPTEAGIYLAVALYADKDDSTGKLIKAGGNAAVLVIRPAKPDFALNDTFKIYNGNEHFSDMTNPMGMDHVKIAIDRDSNEVFVELPADYKQFVAMLPAELESQIDSFITSWEAADEGMGVDEIQYLAEVIINDTLIPADLTGKLMSELNKLADAVSAKISASISEYGQKAENYAESKVTAKLKAELKAMLSGHVSEQTIDEYVDLLTKAIDFDGTTVSVADRNAVIGKAQASTKALITKYAGSEVDALVQGKIDDVIAEVVTAVYTHEEYGIEHLVDVVNYAIARLSALEVDDAEKIVKLSLAVASKVIDVDDILNAVSLVITKVLEAGYLDYLDTLVRGLDTIYDVEIDGLKSAVLGLKPMIASMINKMTTKEGDLTGADIQALEKQLDEVILPELLAVINQLPADGKIYLNKMPKEIGKYDTFAINFAANYAPVIAEAELVIGIEAAEICAHSWSDWTITKEADCENEGSKTRTCELCKATETKTIPALGHDYVATVTEPTCTEDGYTTYKCSRCDASYTADKVAALGHDWGEWIVTKEPQVGIDGEETRTCKRCGETETRPIPALDPDEPDDPDEPSDDKHRCWGPCCNMNFDDVKPHHWFYNDVHYVYCTGLMKGISKDLFGPNMTTTRGMIVTILYRMEGEPTVKTDCTFEDVAADMYYEDPITWAAANGIVYGYNDKAFGPEDYITREQMAAILYRYAEYKGYDTTDRADLGIFSDAGKISAYAVDAMSWAVAEGLINGMGDGTVAPQGNALRAQAAALLHRYCVKVADMPEKYKTEGCRHYR